MAKELNPIDAKALDWVVRVGDPAFADWEAFQAWLAADPGHAARYKVLCAEVDAVVDLLATDAAAAPRIVEAPRSRSIGRLPFWIGGAIAACLAVVVGYPALHRGADRYDVVTAAAETRSVPLPDGSRIDLGGATRITLDRNDPRVASLDHGEAMFSIRHDASDPFVVTVGGHRLVDVGTAFDVKRTGDQTRIAVSQGVVDYTQDDRSIRLLAGQGLAARDGVASLVSTQIDVGSVGSWRLGTLAYNGTPIAEVASDLSRSLGVTVTVDRSIADRPFYGSVVVADVKRDPALLGPILDVASHRSGNAWVLFGRP